MIRSFLLAVSLLALSACSLPGGWGGEPTPTLFPNDPTRGPLPVATDQPAPLAQPSATADAARLPQAYAAPDIGLSFRYPADWTISETPGDSEWLVSAQSGADGVVGLFTLNVKLVGGELGSDQLRRYAERYVATLFPEEEATVAASYRQEGATLLASVRRTEGINSYEYELRFRSETPFVLIMALLGREAEWSQIAPLLDEMARSVALVPPESAAALPTATPTTQATSDGLAVQVAPPFSSPTGAIIVVGQVTNSSPTGYEGVLVTATLLDASGSPLQSATAPIVRNYLAAGASSPVRLLFDPPPPGAASLTLAVEGLPTGPPPVQPSLEVAVSSAGKPALGNYEVQGTATNSGPTAASVTLTAVLFGPSDELLAVESVTLDPSTLVTGQSAPFTITFYAHAPGEITRHEIMVEGVVQ